MKNTVFERPEDTEIKFGDFVEVEIIDCTPNTYKAKFIRKTDLQGFSLSKSDIKLNS